MSLRGTIKRRLPWPLLYLYRKLYYLPKDLPAACGFIFNRTKSPTTFGARLRLVCRFYKISYLVDCPHTEHEIIAISKTILNLGAEVPGAVVEAGAFHGGSTAKFSLVAKLCSRELHVFDSFEGMPENNESYGKSIYGREHRFPKGSHAVRLEEVRENIRKYGDLSRCHFYKGWLKDTLPEFKGPVAAACVNVDLAESTKDCFRYLYPLLSRGGVIVSQDAHFPWIIALLKDDAFWRVDVGIERPPIEGLGSSKFVFVFRR